MTRAAILVAFQLVAMVFVFAAMAFAKWDFNPANWGFEARAMTAVFWVLLAAPVSMIISAVLTEEPRP